MKSRNFLLVCSVVVHSLSAQNLRNTTQLSIESDRVGSLKINSEIWDCQLPSELESYITIKKEYTEGGEWEQPMISVTKGAALLLQLSLEYNYEEGNFSTRIGEIEVLHPSIKTKRGIGVGSTLTELLKAYPDLEIGYTYISDRYIATTEKMPQVQFLIANEYIIFEPDGRGDWVKLEASDFKLGAKIKEVRLF